MKITNLNSYKANRGSHITARQKQVIAYALENNFEFAQSSRIKAVIEAKESNWARVRLFWNESDDWGRKVVRQAATEIRFAA